MKKSLIVMFTALVATSAFAQQIRTPRPSPKATLTQTVGVTDVTINYSRPAVRGRAIWGALVPWNQVWRTGANEATTITFADEVTIDGQKLPKGTYSLHTIPGQNEWTVIFNSVADQWGSYSYDAAKDVVRVKARPQTAEMAELLTFEVPRVTADEATFLIRWEKVAVPFTVNTNSVARTLTSFRNALKPSWQTPYMAANFAFENNAATPEEINSWIEQSLAVNQNLANLWLKARVQERAGDRAAAIRTAELAISKATEQQKDFAAEVKRQSDAWRTK